VFESDRMLEEGSAQHANSMSGYICGVSEYIHMGYVEDYLSGVST
jgi:hypothetical protein